MKLNTDLKIYQHNCITTYIPTYKKGIYYFNKIRRKHGGNKQLMNNPIPTKSTDFSSVLDQLKKDNCSSNDINQYNTIMDNDISKMSFDNPSTYLSSVERYISNNLISNQNYSQIKNIAQLLSGNFTSFFGFEFRLNSFDQKSDYLIAVSSFNGEREALLNLIKQKEKQESIFHQSEWQHIERLTELWADPSTELNKKILGLWLEFDTANKNETNGIPSIFLQTIPLRIDSSEDIKQCRWITQTAIPTLTGHPVSDKLEKQFFHAIKKLPKGASVFHVASMLSRDSEGIRLVIKSIDPDDIIPYLTSLGWSDQGDELASMIKDIKHYSNCIRLHININEKIDPKIGLECFISPDRYHQGDGWDDFLNYLIEKNICIPDMKKALLGFPGIDQENVDDEFSFESYLPTVKLPDEHYSKAIVRYISHVKISYNPGHQTEAKAYTGVRMFGKIE